MAKAPSKKRPTAKRPRTKRPADPPLRPQRAAGLARIEYLKIENYRALRSVELEHITPLTVLLGPNGSGKSTIFDVFNFLSECFAIGLRKAWDKRGRFKELRTRGSQSPIVIELRYRETPDAEPSTYRLEIDEVDGNPVVAREYLKFRRVARDVPGAPYMILSFRHGRGWAIAGPSPVPTDKKLKETLDEPDMLAVSTLGRLAKHPRVAALRRFISDWYVSYLSVDDARGVPEAGAQDRLSKTGDNLANVVQHLQEQHPRQLLQIFQILARRVPQLEKVVAEQLPDGRLMLRIKDAPFDDPILARFASDGTLKMLAYLVVLHDPTPPQFIGIEEPENFLHPRLLLDLAEECRAASERAQLLVTTHSPFFVDGLRAGELRILYRDGKGHTNIVRASDVAGVTKFIEAGGALGQLWMEGHLDVHESRVAGTSSGTGSRGGKK